MSDTPAGYNALMRPVQNPATRFAGPAAAPIGLSGPRMGADALAVPVATQPPPEPPAVSGAAPEPPVGEVSLRVPAPATDFHPDEHADLHKAMGPTFEKPDAAAFVREAYDAIRDRHPHISPRSALLSARDAWHAVQHGF